VLLSWVVVQDSRRLALLSSVNGGGVAAIDMITSYSNHGETLM
jgi:hypothetical protein